MRKEEFDKIARQQPFQPFEVRLVDGRIFRFKSSEQFIVTRSAIITVDEEADGLLINLGLIATIRVGNGRAVKA
ncbi:MAG: hypothetical protein HYY17_15845 [Planctomycetes bacterium]|nr:hypothetical protein [Planctomycetota bacterium]